MALVINRLHHTTLYLVGGSVNIQNEQAHFRALIIFVETSTGIEKNMNHKNKFAIKWQEDLKNITHPNFCV